jgi:hypothetical protein
MSCVGGSPIDCVHLLSVLLDGHIDEEAWAGEAGISADLTDPAECERVIAEVTSWNSGAAPDVVWCCRCLGLDDR